MFSVGLSLLKTAAKEMYCRIHRQWPWRLWWEGPAFVDASSVGSYPRGYEATVGWHGGL